MEPDLGVVGTLLGGLMVVGFGVGFGRKVLDWRRRKAREALLAELARKRDADRKSSQSR